LTTQAINIQVYRWAGSWGPFKVNIPCGECSLTKDIIQDTIDADLEGISIKLDIRDWLSEWWKPLARGGWHAPIIMVEGKIISQGRALNRGVLIQAVIEAYANRNPIDPDKNIIFGKESCSHCVRAKKSFDDQGVDYTYYDVVKEPRALYEMLARVKPIVGEKTPVTVPQIWMKSNYIGGASELSKKLDTDVVM
jgi:glutaredoxin